MVFFRYKALDNQNLKKKGLVEALTLEEAQRELFNQGFFLTEIKPVLKKKEIPSKKELAIFTEELSKLLSASLPLYEALVFLKEKYQRSSFFFFLSHLSEEVKKGRQLSQAMKSFSDKLDFLYIAMIDSGERGGNLEQSLNEITLLLKKELALKKKIFSALAYPLFLMFFCFLVLGVLFFFVLPSLFDLFEGKRLHPLTQLVFRISYFLNTHKTSFLILLVSFSSLLGCFVAIKDWKNKVFSFILSHSFFKSFFLKAALVRFAQTLSLLLTSGVSYLEALKLSRGVARYPVLEREIEEAEKKVMQGKRLSEAFLGSRNIPPLMQRMIELAEESADMAGMIGKTSELMEEDLEKKIQRITTLLGPALLLLLGFLVGMVVLSVLIPLTDVGAFID